MNGLAKIHKRHRPALKKPPQVHRPRTNPTANHGFRKISPIRRHPHRTMQAPTFHRPRITALIGKFRVLDHGLNLKLCTMLDLSQNFAIQNSLSTVSILNGNLENISTSGVGNSLIQFDVSPTATANLGAGTGDFSGVAAPTLSAIPEPSALALCALGSMGLIARRRRNA